MVNGLPDWFPAEMPQGYQTRLAEIRRLTEELRDMDQIGRVLLEVGQPLAEAVQSIFAALKLTTELAPLTVTVKLDAKRRLLIHVSDEERVIERKSGVVARAFQLLHEHAGEQDRVVLVSNADCTTRPADRVDAITPDAHNFLQRMGVNLLPAPTLFKLWALSHQDQNRAKTNVDRLHAQDGGAFVLLVPKD